MRLAPSILLAAFLVSCTKAPDDTGCEDAVFFADADGDGFGDEAATQSACVAPAGFVAEAGDCDDADASVYPSAPEQCTDAADKNCDGAPGMSDGDQDGTAACEDCDDTNPDAHPGAAEVCDGADNDCDGRTDVDATDATVWYLDEDGDGTGTEDASETACEAPDGYVGTFGDCADDDAGRHPGAAEDDCTDPVDYNCDGSVGYADDDVDGFAACEDCDDEDAAVNADAVESCNGIDDDCDAAADEAGSVGERSFFPDLDGDTYGDAAGAVDGCASPGAGWVEIAGDCDDGDAAYNPAASETCDDPNDYNCDGSVTYADADKDGFPACLDCDDTNATVNADATETCDGIDDDCDGDVDEDSAADAGTWYLDADSDTYGDDAMAHVSCAAPDGYVAASGDCDDIDPAYNPGAPEVCDDPNDYNCDGEVEYADADDDGFAACEDCDDSDDAVNDDGIELCNTIDDDCDGTVDESSAADAKTWYKDGDGDSFGDASIPLVSCTQPSGYVADKSDCDDARGSVHPSGAETCNGLDDDCDGTADEGASDAVDFYPDADSDGFGAGTPVHQCTAPSGYVTDHTDCDDAMMSVHPGATETCNSDDDDCDGSTDESGATGESEWYADRDDDGYGDLDDAIMACDAPSGYIEDDSDCDDGDAASNPGADEYCDDADNDCDGETDEDSAVDASTWYADSDHDTYGDLFTPTVACSAPTGFLADSTDCDDTESSIRPGATEACNGYDDDCDGASDEAGSTGETTWYRDADADAHGDAASSVSACTVPSGYVASSDDCDDAKTAVHPGSTEACNGYDDDCDGASDEAGATGEGTWYRDADGDTYGTSGTTASACTVPSGYVGTSGDCDDAKSTVHPGAAETCNATDDDCDGGADEDLTFSTYYADSDGDGYGVSSSTVVACAKPTGYAASADDCDASDASVYPGATEYCDGRQTDCNTASWTAASDDGIVSIETTGGAWSNTTISRSSTTVTALTLPASGTVWLCGGTYYGKLSFPASSTAALKGRYGYTKTAIDANDTATVVTVASTANVTISGLTVQNGKSATTGGGVVNNGTLSMSSSRITSNIATTSGGGLVGAANSTTTLTDVLVDDNDANATWSSSATTGGGGMYFLTNSTWTLSGTTVKGNRTTANGGGIAAAASAASPSKGTMSDLSTVTDNKATGNGGGIYMSATQLSCTGTTASTGVGFVRNQANAGGSATGGGGVYMSSNNSNKLTGVACDFGTTSTDDNMNGTTANDLNVVGTGGKYTDDQDVVCVAPLTTGPAVCTPAPTP